VAIPGATAAWGWVQANSNMVVYPQLYNPAVTPAQYNRESFPIINSFNTVATNAWGRPKFDRAIIKPFSPSSPGGDGNALFLTSYGNMGDGPYETIIVGKPESRNYYVESDVYFNYNPPYGIYERYGIFLRDDGFAGFDDTFEGRGNCYAMMWDSDDGRLRTCKIVDATITNFLAPIPTVPSSGWHKMRIEAENNSIRYYLDGTLQAQVTDTTFISGPCGIGYKSYLSGDPSARGAYFDNFKADALAPATVEDWALLQ
jgi:hypothetical protein